MPTYEYRCANGHLFERFQRMADPPIDACPECGAPAERLLSTGAGLLFKGSGFYITDYRSESYKKAAQAESGGGGKAGGGSGEGGGGSGEGGKSGGGSGEGGKAGGSGEGGKSGESGGSKGGASTGGGSSAGGKSGGSESS
jgi:putative FmdB family regulatory protein